MLLLLCLLLQYNPKGSLPKTACLRVKKRIMINISRLAIVATLAQLLPGEYDRYHRSCSSFVGLYIQCTNSFHLVSMSTLHVQCRRSLATVPFVHGFSLSPCCEMAQSLDLRLDLNPTRLVRLSQFLLRRGGGSSTRLQDAQ